MSPTLLSGPHHAPASGVVRHAVILLHGVGSNGDDLAALAPIIEPALPDTIFISPHAPFAFDMAPFGYQWFSLADRDPAALRRGAEEAAPHLDALIDATRAQYALHDADIALLGFSQGTMTALYAGLRRPAALAGIVGFSGALIGGEDLAPNGTPVCLIHGEWDDVVPFSALGIAQETLESKGVIVETHARPGLGHSIDGEGLEAAVRFLQQSLKIPAVELP